MLKNNFHVELSRCSCATLFFLLFISVSWVATRIIGTYQILSDRDLLPRQLESEATGGRIKREAFAFTPFAFLVRLEIHVTEPEKAAIGAGVLQALSSQEALFEGVFVENYFWFFGFYERVDSSRELKRA